MFHGLRLPRNSPVRRPLPITLTFLGLSALWIVFGKSLSDHNRNPDEIIPVLASLYKWTPMYWGEGRFGLVLGLFAMPIKHPLHNLLFQNCCAAFLGLSAFVLLPAHLAGAEAATAA